MANILIVDDKRDIRLLMKDILEVAGHSIAHFSDGNEAIKTVTDGAYEIAFVDLFMPEIDGLELIPRLARADLSMRIVAMSGGALTVEAAALFNAAETFGAATTLEKPFSVAQLRELVDGLLS